MGYSLRPEIRGLRSAAQRVNQGQTGLLGGLADPVTARALSAMHKDVADSWDRLQSGPVLRCLAVHLCRPVSQDRAEGNGYASSDFRPRIPRKRTSFCLNLSAGPLK
jgi:hypothetical protein